MSYALVEYNDEHEEMSRRVLSKEMIEALLDRSFSRRATYLAIDNERDYQDRVWESESTPGQANELAIGEFVLLLEEYVLRARAEWVTAANQEATTLHYIRKIAGIAVNCMEQHGAPERDTFRAEALTKSIDEIAGGMSCRQQSSSS